MEGTFELNKPGYYKVLNAVENEFLNNRLESDQYGIYYSVRFEGDAETYLWQAKTAPIEGEKYWGHIEESKSGKSMRFKKDKLPDNVPVPAGSSMASNGDAITASMATKLAFQAFIQTESMLPQEDKHWLQIEYMAEMLFATIANVKEGTKPERPVVGPVDAPDSPLRRGIAKHETTKKVRETFGDEIIIEGEDED